MMKLATLRSDIIFLEQSAIVLKEAKIDILAAFYLKGTCYYDDCYHPNLFKHFFEWN